MFSIYDGREAFYQWDLNQKLIVYDDSITEVHFCNRTDDCALVCEVYKDGSLSLVNVPNVLLQDNWTIRVYAIAADHTEHEDRFKVISRSKPADYVYTETEVKNWDSLEERLEELEGKKVDLTGYATEEYVNNAIAGIEIPEVEQRNPDWEQNDPTAKDYIKNRPFYEKMNYLTIKGEDMVDMGNGMYFYQNEEANVINLYTGNEYITTIDSNKYISKSREFNGVTYYGNGDFLPLLGTESDNIDIQLPFIIVGSDGMIIIVTNSSFENMYTDIGGLTVEKVPDKFIPNAIKLTSYDGEEKENQDYIKIYSSYDGLLDMGGIYVNSEGYLETNLANVCRIYKYPYAFTSDKFTAIGETRTFPISSLDYGNADIVSIHYDLNSISYSALLNKVTYENKLTGSLMTVDNQIISIIVGKNSNDEKYTMTLTRLL